MFLKYTKWAFGWAFLILILCGIPGRDIPHISFLELLSFDKFVHAGIFFVLTLLLIRGFVLQQTLSLFREYSKPIALVICIVYGASLEIMQATFFEGRSASFFDFIANSFGSLMGLWLYYPIEQRFLKFWIK